MNELTMLELVLQASVVVQVVMGLLLLMSIMSWAVGLAKSFQLRRARKANEAFENLFWQNGDLTALYNQVSGSQLRDCAASEMFDAGYREFIRLKKQGVSDVSDLVSGTQRVMRVVFTRYQEKAEGRIPTLATIGSSAPYIGLFGTVWGVMDAFASLGSMPNATLSAVAPGISEALIATAMGLFAAIPAVIAYNRLSIKSEKLLNQYENFAESLLTLIQREAHSITQQPAAAATLYANQTEQFA